MSCRTDGRKETQMSYNNDVRDGAKTAIWVALAAVVVAVVITGITFAGYEAGWWFKSNDNMRTTNMIRHSVSAQNSYVTEVENNLPTISDLDAQIAKAPADQKPGLQGEKTAIVNQTCMFARKIDASEMQSDIASFLSQDCATP